MSTREWTQEAVADRLKNLFGDEVPSAGDSLVAAAAVLSTFDVEALKPYGAPPDDIVAARDDLLARSSETITADRRKRWVLARDARRAALRGLIDSRAVEAALAANPDRARDDVQRMLEAVLRDPSDLPPLDKAQDVRAYQIVADWLSGLVPGLLDPQALRNLADRTTQLAPFRELVGEFFAGRAAELAQLDDYVDVRPPSGTREFVSRAVRSVLSIVEEPPLFISGPGGIGKSTLVAKFILDHVDDPAVPRFPYAYLDLDRPGLVAEEPITLLIEALRQLARQYPESRASLATLQREWATRIAGTAPPPPSGMRDETGTPAQTIEPERASDEDPSGKPVVKRFEAIWSKLRLGERDYYLETFAHAVRALEPTPRPMLLVVDTFEEVQLRSAAHVGAIFKLLDGLQQQLPFLRTVLCGRVAPEGYKVKELRLTRFDLQAATAYLTARVKVDRDTAEAVASQLSGSPLALKLAADLLAQAQSVPGGLIDLSPIIGELRKGSIEAQLYTRVLKHIIDPDVRKIAHPGLVLRRITPEIIEQVLAGPCGFTVPDRAAAEQLFEKLKQEVVLVTERSPRVLVHRPELREVMLGPLLDAEGDRIRPIHEAAVRYYERQPPDPELRAEEIYHRLSLGFDRRTLEARWMDGMDRYFAGAVPELTPQAQGFLASRLEFVLDPAIWLQADVQDWERYALREVRDFLRVDRVDDALALVARRNDYTSVELKLLRVEALARTADLAAAAAAARKVRSEVPPDSDAARRLQAVIRATEAPPSSGRKPPRTRRTSDPVQADVADGGAPNRASFVSIKALTEALADAFPNAEDLVGMLATYELSEAIGIDPAGAPLLEPREAASLASLVVSRAASSAALPQLVVAARRARPTNGRLWSVADSLGLLPRGLSDLPSIQQSILLGRHTGELRAALTRLEGQVCTVEVPEKVVASGFLVGPDLVLTTAAIFGATAGDVSARADRVVVTFDRWVTDTDVTMRGVSVGVVDGSEGTVAWSLPTDADGLGYALLRLGQPIGDAPGAARGKRGWMTLQTQARITRKTAVATLRFDSRRALTFSLTPTGMRERDDKRRRLQYEIEGEAGGSGNPVFDDELRVVALQIARVDTSWLGGLTRRQVREGAPADLIVDSLAARGIKLPAEPSSPRREA